MVERLINAKLIGVLDAADEVLNLLEKGLGCTLA